MRRKIGRSPKVQSCLYGTAPNHNKDQNCLVFDLLLCIGGGEFGLSNRKSEIFPLETRAMAIACFYALGTAIGGSTSPLLFGWLIESGSAWRVSGGYALAAALLLIAGGTELMLGIDAEGKSLESIADPLSSK